MDRLKTSEGFPYYPRYARARVTPITGKVFRGLQTARVEGEPAGCAWPWGESGGEALAYADRQRPTRENKRPGGLLCPFPGDPKKDRACLRRPSNRGQVVASIEPDQAWSGMSRVRLPDEHLSDMVNLSRANDAAASLALPKLNRSQEAS